MNAFTQIDLSKLPAPAIIETVAYEELLAEMKQEAVRQMPELEPFLALESEPTTKLLRVCAYHRMLDRLEFNDNAKGNMLALSTGTNLDGLAAFWGVERLIVQSEDSSVSPAIEQILEDDAAFRKRIQLSMEGHTTAGPRGSFVFWALSASGDVKDVSVESPTPGVTVVTVLSHSANGAASTGLLNTVETALNDEDVRPMGHQVIVQPATVIPYEVEAVLTLYNGPAEDVVLETAQSNLAAYIDEHHRIGHDITLAGLTQALYVPGAVQNVQIISPAADIVVDNSKVAFCTATPAVTVGGRDV